MKTYNVEVDVTTRWTIEVHADDEDEASAQAEAMTPDEIEALGDLEGSGCVEVVSIEEKSEEWEEDDET